MSRLAILNLVGLTRRHVGQHTPHLAEWLRRKQIVPIEPVLPAVTCAMQSTFLTGRVPAQHGIVGNGWYDRTLAEVHFWKQSNHLVTGEKFWDRIKREHPDYTVAKLFWWYNRYSTADFTLTPRPIYRADGAKVFDIDSHPAGIREKIKADLGDFPFPSFWGPMSGIGSSHWIAESAKWIEEKYWPNLSLVYLPHLDYDFQRFGPDDPASTHALRQLDALFGDLLAFYKNRAIKVIVLSEYGITPVDRPVHLNRVFRERGWIEWRDELGSEAIDLGESRAFAVADHQIAHVYVNDKAILDDVRAVVQATPGVERVLEGMWRNLSGLDHPRSGDLVAIADSRSWFTYYWWLDDARAPDYARCVDIHRKPGYDPVELFLDPAIKRPRAAVAKRLIRKKLGFRTLMDLIPLDATLVRGSHGRIPESPDDWPILGGSFPHLANAGKIFAPKVFEELLGAAVRGLGSDDA